MRNVRRIVRAGVAALLAMGLAGHIADPVRAADAAGPFATVWTASMQGPYPSGYPSAQPNLSFAFPDPARGAHDQTFRLIVRPDVWGSRARLRFSNAFGTMPVTIDGVYAGERALGASLLPGSNAHVSFGGKSAITLAPGAAVLSDPVTLAFGPTASPADRLAVSFHVRGDSGPMTWHAKALTTSYVTPPGSGAHGDEIASSAFTYATASWFFLDAVEMEAPATKTIVAFGDSITDGTDSTMNGDDRWPDRLSQRLHATFGENYAIVNEGIGGNRLVGPKIYTPALPFAGGPSAESRLARDVLTLANVGTVIVFEGINDFGKSGENTTPAQAEAGLARIVRRIRTALPNAHVIGATLTTALGSTNKDHGSPEEDAERKAFNSYVRSSGLFDAVIDFDAVTLDPATGRMKPAYVPDNTVGGPGDGLHPNRAGYGAMADAVDLDVVTGHTMH